MDQLSLPLAYPPTSGSMTPSLREAIRTAAALGADRFGGSLSGEESRLLREVVGGTAPSALVEAVRQGIQNGEDPLGDILRKLRGPAERRGTGTFLTPPEIRSPMMEWVLSRAVDQVVDAGAGTGRFAADVLRRAPSVPVIAVESDPFVSLLCRAHLAQIGGDVTVLNADYRSVRLPRRGRTGFVGNPPYVRHHDLPPSVKEWAGAASARMGKECSKLAGLHVYFFLATALHANEGDVGCFVTSAEWLDVNYGGFLRWLLTERLTVRSLHLLRAGEVPFEDAMTTALITCFEAARPCDPVRVRVVESVSKLSDLDGNGRVERVEALRATRRWSSIISGTSGNGAGSGEEVALGSFVRVHRGIATGANRFFVMSRAEARSRGLLDVCRPCVSGAREVIEAEGVLRRAPSRKLLLSIDPSVSMEALAPAVREYLLAGEAQGVAERYLCRTRRPWWSLGRPSAPPIVMTYMARRPPVFARNPEGLLLLNVAHGIYPAGEWSTEELDRLVRFLNRESAGYVGQGRTYHGGLEKFEPSEAEALPVPPPEFFRV